MLAAGASTRLGAPKALARLRDGPGGSALELLLAAGRAFGDPFPLVLAGADHGALAAALAHAEYPHELVQHLDWSAGRTSSVARAAELRTGRDLCIAPVDVPLVPREVFAALRSAWEEAGAPARGWLAPFVPSAPTERRFGHPVLVGRELAARLKAFPPERPLSSLRAEAAPLLALEVASAAILDDLDSPADLARLRSLRNLDASLQDERERSR
jgi:CTP:molybdopterin cytidylyltransferase MocA